MVELVTFLIAGGVVLGGALGVVLMPNTTHAALSLVATLFGVAVLFIAQEAHFLAAVQVIVYAGAIVVLFLFVMMLLGVDREDDVRNEPLRGQRPAAIIGGVLFLGMVLVALLAGGSTLTGVRGELLFEAGFDPNVVLLGRSLFTDYIVAFEATAILLTVAAVGAVVLVRRGADDDDAIDRDSFGGDALDAGGRPMIVTESWYLVLGAMLFTIGGVGLLIRRNPLVMFMCVELMLNAVNLTFVTFSTMLSDIKGQTVVFFVLVVAATEVVVGLAIIVAIMRRRPDATADDIALLKG